MDKIYIQHFPKPAQVERIVQAKHFIDAHACEDIRLQDMAATACLSLFHFTRLFKKCYGCTPHQHLTTVRISKAKQLLAVGVTVTNTGFSVGYTSITSFTGLFKKITGITPLAYRQKKQFSRAC
jgi:AraC-like DNA-binding protein